MNNTQSRFRNQRDRVIRYWYEAKKKLWLELLQSIQLLSLEPPLWIPLRYCLAGNRRVLWTDVTGVDIRDRGGEGDHDFVGTSQTACDICSRTADVLANKSLPLSFSSPSTK